MRRRRWGRGALLLGLSSLLSAGLAFGQAAPDPAAMPSAPIPYSQLAKPKPKAAKPISAAPAKPKPSSAPTPKPKPKPERKPPAADAGLESPGAAPPRAAPKPKPKLAPPKHPPPPIAASPDLPKPALRQPPPKPPVVKPAVASTAPVSVRPGARLAPAEALPAAELEAFVDGVMREGMAAEHAPGAAVAVVQNGQTVLLKGYGEAAPAAGPGRPARPVDPRATMFRLGTASTLFTALQTARSVELGRLKLDLPVNIYLRPALRLPDEDVASPILIRHLLSQTAGFEERTLGRLYKDHDIHVAPLGAALARERPQRAFASGAVAGDSSYGTALLGAALAETGRRPWNALMEAEVFRPLGMAHTSFREPYPARRDLPEPLAPALAANLFEGYHWTGRGFAPVPFGFAQGRAPAASAATTAEDMARLMTVMLNDGAFGDARLYGPQAAALLRAPLQTTPPGISGRPGGLTAGRLPGGFASLGIRGGSLASRAAVSLAPEMKLGVFVAANSDTAAPLVDALAGRIAARFYAPPAAAAARPGDPAFASRASAYEGRYVSTARARHGLEKVVDRFTRAAELRVGQDGYVAVREGGRTRLYAPEAGQGATPARFRAADGDDALVFTLTDGRAAGFTPGDNSASFTRVGPLLSPLTFELGALGVAICAGLCLVGLVLRARREELRRTDAQAIGGALQALLSVLWLGALLCLAIWLLRTGSSAAALMFTWPSRWFIAASSLALLAFLGSLVSAAQLFEIWRSERRRAGWSRGRKARHTLTAAVFVLYGVLLTLWGALTPWSP